jgi:putative tricarboxylic transport membrane protein
MTVDELAWWDGALGKVMSSPEWAAAAARNLWTVDYKNSKDVQAFLDSENTRLAALLKELGLAKQ